MTPSDKTGHEHGKSYFLKTKMDTVFFKTRCLYTVRPSKTRIWVLHNYTLYSLFVTTIIIRDFLQTVKFRPPEQLKKGIPSSAPGILIKMGALGA